MFSLMDRRDFLRVGSLALGGLTLPGLLAAKATSKRFVRDRAVVLLFLQGGPPQVETFDPKMDAIESVRSVVGEAKTTLPGVSFGGSFPKLAKLADRLAVVRSFGAGKGGLAHERGYELLLTGNENPFNANLGSLYARAAGSINPRSGLPANTIILPESIDAKIQLGNPSGAFTLNQTNRYFAGGGNLGPEYAPFNPSGGGQLLDNLQLRLPREQFDDRRALLAQLDTFKRRLDETRDLDGQDAFQRQAYEVLLRGVAAAFDLSKEDARTQAKYDTSDLVPMKDIRRGGKLYWNNFNRTTNLLGKQMLLARRLCESGCGFVTVVDSCWDFHDDGNNPPVKTGMEVLGPQVDHAISAFLEDVAERGLSEKILLVVTAEMGRTRVKGGKSGGGSGHWGELTPLLLAGGGLKMGQVIGASDRSGLKPATTPYGPQHLLATIMQTLFDAGEARVTPDLPKNLASLITDGKPIAELF